MSESTPEISTAAILGQFRKELIAQGISDDLANDLTRDAFTGLVSGDSYLVVRRG